MTPDRAYRAALSEAAPLELERVVGSRVDPEVVDALRSVLARPREADAAAAQD
jgi:HD-GYP domain-containing protein (c-di-GMP phosphodiesterase class II)